MTANKMLLLFGGGGHCRSVCAIIKRLQLSVKGIIDKKSNVGTFVAGYEIIGTEEDLETINTDQTSAIITVGSAGANNNHRSNMYENIKKKGLSFATVVSDRSMINSIDEIGAGSVVLDGAIINIGAQIGNNCIINTGAIIEHDCVIGNGVHVSCRAVVCGGVEIGDGAFIGAGSTIIQGMKIGAGIIVAAGAVVVKDLKSPGIYAGIPARLVQKDGVRPKVSGKPVFLL